MIANDLINMALRAAGVLGTGQTAPAEMTNQAVTSLNALMGQWAAKRWLTFRTVNLTANATGASTYTVGPAADFAIAARPSSLEYAYISQNMGAGQVDTAIEVLKAREDYNRISLKGIVSMPWAVFYDNAMPLGTLYFWPIPTSGRYSMTITVKAPLAPIATANLLADMGLPPEFDEALIYNLAVRVCAIYQQQLTPEIVALAKAGLGTIRANNTQIAKLRMPSGMTRQGRFNIYSGVGQ